MLVRSGSWKAAVWFSCHSASSKGSFEKRLLLLSWSSKYFLGLWWWMRETAHCPFSPLRPCLVCFKWAFCEQTISPAMGPGCTCLSSENTRALVTWKAELQRWPFHLWAAAVGLSPLSGCVVLCVWCVSTYFLENIFTPIYPFGCKNVFGVVVFL